MNSSVEAMNPEGKSMFGDTEQYMKMMAASISASAVVFVTKSWRFWFLKSKNFMFCCCCCFGGAVDNRKMEETGFEIICSAPTTLAVKG